MSRIFGVRLVDCSQYPNLIVLEHSLSLGREKRGSKEGKSQAHGSKVTCVWHSFSIYRRRADEYLVCFQCSVEPANAARCIEYVFFADRGGLKRHDYNRYPQHVSQKQVE